MTTLLLLSALAVAGLGGWLSRRWRGVGFALLGLGGLGLLGVLGLQLRQYVFTPEPKAPSRCSMAVSSGLASCLLGDVVGQSGKVVLLLPPRRLLDEEGERSYEEGFLPPLRHGGAQLHLKVVHLDDPGRDGHNGLAALQRALAQEADALAFVSYAGAPAGLESLFAEGQPKTAPLYLFDPEGTSNWLGPLKAGRIRAVIVPRPGVDARERQSLTGRPEAILERAYLVATPANADQVAAGLPPPNARH